MDSGLVDIIIDIIIKVVFIYSYFTDMLLLNGMCLLEDLLRMIRSIVTMRSSEIEHVIIGTNLR